MSVMSEVHQDLATIHAIMLGQRQVAQDLADKAYYTMIRASWVARVDTINDLLLEFETAGITFPDNVRDIHG